MLFHFYMPHINITSLLLLIAYYIDYAVIIINTPHVITITIINISD